jgi:hypothetical protein
VDFGNGLPLLQVGQLLLRLFVRVLSLGLASRPADAVLPLVDQRRERAVGRQLAGDVAGGQREDLVLGETTWQALEWLDISTLFSSAKKSILAMGWSKTSRTTG